MNQNPKIQPNDLFFLDLQDDFKPMDTNDVARFFEEHVDTLNKSAAESNKRSNESSRIVSEIRIEGDSRSSEKRDEIIKKFVEKFPCDDEARSAIREICGSYILEPMQQDVPLLRLFHDENGNIRSFKPYNYVAQFRLKDFIRDLCDLHDLGEPIGPYGQNEKSIFDFISDTLKTFVFLWSQGEKLIIKFDERYSQLIKAIIIETQAGIKSVPEYQIIARICKEHPEISKDEIYQMNTELDLLGVISIDSDNISLIERRNKISLNERRNKISLNERIDF